MNRNKKNKNGALYIVICSCALIIAVSGYVNRASVQEEKRHEPSEIVEIEHEEILEETSQKAEVEVPDVIIVEETSGEPEETKEPEVIEFASPVRGNVIGEYSGDDLVYNEALKDWRAHSGVDFEAEMGEEVRASAKGRVESVFDSGLGRCVIIDHQNGYATMYANLEENTKVKEGDEVNAGDVIGAVGNTALGDITDLPHVHFEMMKDGNNVNPADFLN